MEQSAMIAQTAWQNALYINAIKYSSILITYYSLQELLDQF